MESRGRACARARSRCLLACFACLPFAGSPARSLACPPAAHPPAHPSTHPPACPSTLSHDARPQKLEAIGKLVRERDVDAVLYLDRLDSYKVDLLERKVSRKSVFY